MAKKFKITPTTITKLCKIFNFTTAYKFSIYWKIAEKKREIKGIKHLGKQDLQKEIARIEKEMKLAATNLEFEKAIELRDNLEQLKTEIA